MPRMLYMPIVPTLLGLSLLAHGIRHTISGVIFLAVFLLLAALILGVWEVIDRQLNQAYLLKHEEERRLQAPARLDISWKSHRVR